MILTMRVTTTKTVDQISSIPIQFIVNTTVLRNRRLCQTA